jgi:hypothetical protein
MMALKGARDPDAAITRRHLPHDLIGQAEYELLFREFGQGSKMDRADRTDHCVDLAGYPAHGFNGRPIGDIGMNVAAVATNLDDLMTARQLVAYSGADCTFGPNHNQFQRLSSPQLREPELLPAGGQSTISR